MDKILRLNTRTGVIRETGITDEQRKWGGRGFIAYHFLNEVDPMCDPLGRKNTFIISAGLLTDTPVTTAGRCSVGGKSPLTKGVKECNVGGHVGKMLAKLGFKALMLEDKPERHEARILFIGKDSVRLDSYPHLVYKTVNDTIDFIHETYGAKVGLFCVGPAGEMGMGGAAVATADRTGEMVRFAARGGLGAVMGVKGIKAVVLDDSGVSGSEFFDRKALIEASREIARVLLSDPKTKNRNEYGTPAVLALCNTLGILPTRNFSSGSFELADKINGEYVREAIIARGGEGRKGLPCVPGCVIQCSNIFPDKSGKKRVATLQYESIALLGSNCGIGDIDEIAELNHLCNEAGVDTIETGAAIGVAMESGLLDFGDAEGAKDLVRQIAQGTPLGRIIGNGSVATGMIFNVQRVPAVKGQAMPAYDPRALKGIGVTYAMSPMGADHTAGNALETAGTIDPLGREGQIEVSYRLQVRAAILDSLGVCLFIRPAFVKNPELAAQALNARYGWTLTYADVQTIGIECLNNERAFNHRSGASDLMTDVPEFLRMEPLPPNNTVYDIPKEQLDSIWNTKLPRDVF